MEKTIGISKAKGSVSAPPSKSLAHRYIISAALSEGKSVISNIDYSEDILATLDCIEAMGAKVTKDGSTVIIEGAHGKSDSKKIDFYCRESGSTMRFFMGLAMYLGIECNFYGSKTLLSRPFGIYEDICEKQNIEFTKSENSIRVNGKIEAGNFEIPGNVSSQFITGLLYALPMLDNDSMIKLIPPIESKSYINLTLQALQKFGINADWVSDCWIKVKGGQNYKATNEKVEGDYSNAAFLEAFNLIGGNVTVDGLNPDSLQGDKVYTQYFEALKEEGATLNISNCPDLGPVLFAMAAALNGAVFTGTRRLKIKESDRGRVMCEELAKFGVSTYQEEDRVTIFKSSLKKPETVLCGTNDHRIVMSLALLCSLTGGVINDAEAVRKSFPQFFDVIKELGIEVK